MWLSDSQACNYDSDATIDNNSCIYAETYYYCNGNCINDTDGDSVCDELEITGCMDNTALNYNPSATDDDGSCMMSIDLSMSDELELTISLSHPLDSIGFLGFSVVYNTNVLNISSYSKGQFELLFTNLDYDIYESASFVLSNITVAGTLLTLQFQGANYEGTTIYLSDISIVENNGEEILLDDSNFYSESICYISVHPTTGEILFGGEYQWTNNFCSPLNYNP